MVFVLDIDILARRRPVAKDADAGRMQPDGRQTVGLGIGQRAEHQGIHHAEDRGIRADADGQGEHDHHGRAGVLAQHAQGVTEVLG